MSRLGLLLLASGALASGVAHGQEATIECKQIDVKARLDNDGRLHVVETHHMRVQKGGFPLGHAYFQLPELPPGAGIAYRFEYELLKAVSPAWGIAAGPDALIERVLLVSPWRRLQSLLADWREARPDPSRRYFLDHDVLLPSREGPGDQVRQLDYQLAFDTAWRRVHPAAELFTVREDSDYRVRPLFEYLKDGRPAAASWREAALRLASLAMRSVGPIDSRRIAEELLPLAPEAVAASIGGALHKPSVEDVLTRLFSERKVGVEVAPETDADDVHDVRMRLLVPLTSLSAFERGLVEGLFPDGGAETSTARLREHYRSEGFDPEATLRRLLPDPVPTAQPRRWLVSVPLLVLGAYGVALQFRALAATDLVALLLLANFVALALVLAWPKAWWHGGFVKRGLLIPLFLLTAGILVIHLSVNRPLPVEAWIGISIAALAGHAITLVGARMPDGEPYRKVRVLARIRRFARTELSRPYPRLEDKWMPHLLAMGLGGAIEAWRKRHGDADQAPDLSVGGAAEAMAGPRFRGRLPDPVRLPPGWTDGLYVYVDEEEEEEHAARYWLTPARPGCSRRRSAHPTTGPVPRSIGQAARARRDRAGGLRAAAPGDPRRRLGTPPGSSGRSAVAAGIPCPSWTW